MKKLALSVIVGFIVAASVLWLDAPMPDEKSLSIAQAPTAETPIQPVVSPQIIARPQPSLAQNRNAWLDGVRQQLQLNLANSNYIGAIQVFNDAFNQASSDQVEQLKALIVRHSAVLAGESKHQAVVQLLGLYTVSHNDLDAWRMLADAFEISEQWQKALDALLQSNQLEVDSGRYEQNLRRLVRAASNLNTDYQRNGNLLASLALYQSLYEQYPQHPRFQFDLAQAHLALGAENDALALLKNLIYNPELGSLASQNIALIEDDRSAKAAESERQKKPQESSGRQIVVPLIRAGTSLLVDTKIEGRRSRLLLDTGASITALSTRRIQQLGLEPTGQAIQLSTANGVTTSQLYHADSLTVGRIKFNNLVIAEIDLPSNSSIEGLLGTDVLRKMEDKYSYLIDDQRNALIFKARP